MKKTIRVVKTFKIVKRSCSLNRYYRVLSPKEAKKASRKPPGSYKKFQGRNTEIILLVFWKKLIFHKDIMKLTDL